MLLRTSLLALAFLLLTATSASALILRKPLVEVTRGHSVVSAHVVRHDSELYQCAMKEGATTVEARVHIRWNARGYARSITVRGGTAGFRRCAREALAGKLPIVRRRAGSGRASFIVRTPYDASSKR